MDKPNKARYNRTWNRICKTGGQSISPVLYINQMSIDVYYAFFAPPGEYGCKHQQNDTARQYKILIGHQNIRVDELCKNYAGAVEKHMNEDGSPYGLHFDASLSKDNAEESCINALGEIHMVCSKQDCLNYNCGR